MHRHGYKGTKFGRKTDQREALIKGLADSLVLRQSIETTLPKAKAVLSYTEKLITKAKKGAGSRCMHLAPDLGPPHQSPYRCSGKLINGLFGRQTRGQVLVKRCHRPGSEIVCGKLSSSPLRRRKVDIRNIHYG